jgi:hypothetical protein
LGNDIGGSGIEPAPTIRVATATASVMGFARLRLAARSAAFGGFACMVVSSTGLGVSEVAFADPCTAVAVHQIGGVRVERRSGPPATVEFTGGMAIDADGAASAYRPDDTGLDRLADAGAPGDWWALATDADGEPYVQREGDPAPGSYVSTTSLVDERFETRDPRRYVDAARIPYVALPGPFEGLGCALGDLAWVERTARNGTVRRSAALFADVSPPSAPLGEGSIALADRLGIPSHPRTGGTRRASVRYVLFCGSRIGWPAPVAEIDAAAERLAQARRALDTRRCRSD